MTEYADGGCKAAVTARTICGWAKLRECSKLQYGRIPLKQKGLLISYAKPAIPYGSEAWCLKESDMKN